MSVLFEMGYVRDNQVISDAVGTICISLRVADSISTRKIDFHLRPGFYMNIFAMFVEEDLLLISLSKIAVKLPFVARIPRML